EVWAIAQDPMGFLWFGTQNGLCKYDGTSFSTFRHDPDDKASLSDNYVLSLFVDSQGRLWVGTLEGVLERFDRAEDTFTHFPIGERIYDITEDPAGDLWLGTGTPGLLRFDPATGEAETLWETTNVRGVDTDGEGRIWAASTESVIVQIDPFTGARDEYQPDHLIWDLASDPDGRIWLATIAAGVGVLDPREGEFSYNMVNPEVLQAEGNNAIRKVYVDSEGLVWLGHFQTSLLRYDPAENEFAHFVPDLTDPTSVMANSVLALYRDRTGILWVGYGIGGGVSKLVVSGERFGHYHHIPDDPNSLNTNLVIAIAGQGDMLWFGTFSGLDRWNRTTGEWTHFELAPTVPISQTSSTVRSVYVDSRGTLWAGTEQGLERYDPAIDDFIRLGGPVVMWMHEGPSGRLWLAAKDGLYEYDRGFERFDFIHGGHAEKIMVVEDRQGIIWVGTSGDGLERYDPSTNSWKTFEHDPDDPNSLSHNSVEAILEDSSGVIWAATGGGLNRLEEDSGTFTHFTVADGLANDRITGLLEDDFGDLWLATDAGLTRFHPDTATFDNYTPSDGIQGHNFWRNSYFKGEAGELVFGGENGINVFFPENIVPNSLVPPVIITRVSLFNHPLRTDLPGGEHLIFDYDENFLSFDMVALDYTDPQQNQYAYQMVGLDPDWVQAGNRRHADYPNLSPGTYTFRVIGSNNDGVWNEVGASVVITIRPPFWQTGWFIGLAISLALAAGYVAYRWRVRTLEARSRELGALVGERTAELTEANLRLEAEILERQRVEQALADQAAEAAVMEERSRLARDLHDSVTQSIYSSTLLAEAGQRSANDAEKARGTFQRLGEITRQALKEMRLLVYELRPPELEQAGLAGALQARLDAVERRAGVDARLVVYDDFSIEGVGEQALYFVAQEALNNALKHAAPTLVEVRLELGDDGERILRVRDDGLGFDPAKVKGGLGLRSIEERAAALGGTVEIKTARNEGTEIRVTIPQGDG
ncbi:MAG: two-component regulator propeller domain-containing protein, partial [Anaerolineales bacterium]